MNLSPLYTAQRDSLWAMFLARDLALWYFTKRDDDYWSLVYFMAAFGRANGKGRLANRPTR